MTRVIRGLPLWLLITFALAQCVNAQTATYHLHKEASSTTGLFQLKTAGPDGTSLAVQSANLKNQAVGEYLVKAFDTQSGVPNASGVIPAGSSVTFTVWMNKTSSSGVMFPRAKLRLNNATGTLFCTATGSTALTTSLTKYTFSATTSSSISMTTNDRLYVWVGVSVTTVATTNTNATLNIEGTLNGNYDSLTIVPTPMPPPTISSLSTTSGPVGTSVTVTGSNFGATQGTSTVTFNATAATPTSWSATSIAVPVPAAATTGPVVVTVNGQASNGVTFTVTPKINSLSPTSGAVGTSVTINGTTFGATQGTSTVTFNGTVATPTTWSATSIVAPVPTAATTGPVIVTANGQASTGMTFTVNAPGSVSGRINQAGGTVAISGATVRALQGASTIMSAVTNATGDYTLAALVPGTYSIEASATGFGTKRRDLVAVNSGIGTTVDLALDAIITGPVSYIYDAVGRLISTVGPTEIVTYTYDAAGNLLSISKQSSNQLTIINVLPNSGTVGTAVTINGSGFSTVPSENNVQFNGVAAIVTYATATQIVTSVPSLAVTGSIQIAVTNTRGTVTVPFTVLPADNEPRVQVAPANVSIAPGDKVQFTAQVTGLGDQTVTWSVNGIAGGNTSVGTLSLTGYYSSPTQTSSTTIYTIRASSVANSSVFGQAQVAVLNPTYSEAVISGAISVVRPRLIATANAAAISIRKNPAVTIGPTGRVSVRKNASTVGSSPTAATVSVRRLPTTIPAATISRSVSLTTGPYVQSVSPGSASRGTSFTITITGMNLMGVNGLAFMTSAGAIDSNITSSNIEVNGEGTSLTASVTITGTAALGSRIVVVRTSTNHSLAVDVGGNIIQIVQ